MWSDCTFNANKKPLICLLPLRSYFLSFLRCVWRQLVSFYSFPSHKLREQNCKKLSSQRWSIPPNYLTFINILDAILHCLGICVLDTADVSRRFSSTTVGLRTTGVLLALLNQQPRLSPVWFLKVRGGKRRLSWIRRQKSYKVGVATFSSRKFQEWHSTLMQVDHCLVFYEFQGLFFLRLDKFLKLSFFNLLLNISSPSTNAFMLSDTTSVVSPARCNSTFICDK